MKLLEPLKIGNITLKNRIMFPPLTTGYEEKDGSIGEHSFNFYKRLAEGGAGYIVIGDVTPIMNFSPAPKLFNDSQIPTYQKLADAVHEYGCKLGVQIFHPEYHAEKIMSLFIAGKQKEGMDLLHYDMIHFVSEVSKLELIDICEKICNCALRAYKAGVDVCEIHGDRLCGSLCSTILNHRTDEFGGSFENRIRFALMIVDGIKKICPEMTIEYKLPIVTKHKDGLLQGKGGLQIEEATRFAKILEEHGVDAIHVAQANHTGNMNDTIPAMGTRPYGFMIEETKAIKNAVNIPISFVGRITSVQMAESLIQSGVCDYVAFGRNLLTDPYLPTCVETGDVDAIRRCMMCNKGCTDSIMSRRFISCVLNAENGYEAQRIITKTDKEKNVLVVGGGIAGLEATRVLSQRGHKVTLIEKDYKLGGQLNIACIPPRKEEMRRAILYYEQILPKLENVTVKLGHTFKIEDSVGFDEIIIATGAKSLHPNIPGIDNVNVLDSWDVLKGSKEVYGKVVVCGGGLVGAETAEYIASKGYDVSIIEMKEKIAQEESSTILPVMMSDFKKYDTKLLPLHKIKEFKLNGVLTDVVDVDGNVLSEEFILADTIVNALSSVKVLPCVDGITIPIHYIGDCGGQRPSNIENAIKSAYDCAVNI